MGWSGGTEIFDGMVGPVLANARDEKQAERLLTELYRLLSNADWDTEPDTRHADLPLVQRVLGLDNDV